MGIQIESPKERLKEIGAFQYRAEFENGLTEHEIDHVLLGAYDTDNINFNPDEVEAVRWVSLELLKQEFKQTPKIFTPWFPKALDLISQKEIENLFK